MTDHRLILFVTGDAPRSQRARKNLADALGKQTTLTDTHQEVDLLQDPERALEHGVFATPALGLMTPEGRLHLLYGDLSDEASLNRFLAGMEDATG